MLTSAKQRNTSLPVVLLACSVSDGLCGDGASEDLSLWADQEISFYEIRIFVTVFTKRAIRYVIQQSKPFSIFTAMFV